MRMPHCLYLPSGGNPQNRLEILSKNIFKEELGIIDWDHSKPGQHLLSITLSVGLKPSPDARSLPSKVKFTSHKGLSRLFVSGYFMPCQSINPSLQTFNASKFCTQLPDMRNKGLRICLMITPILRGSTVYVRGANEAVDKSAAPPPALCHVRVAPGVPANKELSLNLHKYAADVDKRTIDVGKREKTQV